MASLKLVLLGLAVVSLLAILLLNIAIAILSREIPHLPLNARINPFNALAYRDQWTPQMRAVNRWATKVSILFIGSLLAYLATAFLG